MQWFVRRDSVVRKIWGKPDTILFVFAGAASEFALNKAVDWLFFTGRLPADPLGRLFSTVAYARMIVFSEVSKANEVIDRMALIHQEVEKNRGYRIPAWAYRDVLYMLIDYSIRSYELLSGKLTQAEKEEVFDVFRCVGVRMGITDLPLSFEEWIPDREKHLHEDLEYSEYSVKLYDQYKKHLGAIRYAILRAAQGIIVPVRVRELLRLTDSSLTRLMIFVYRGIVMIRLDWPLKRLILPLKYVDEVRRLETH